MATYYLYEHQLDREISRLDKKIAGMMNYFTNKKFIILN